MTACPGTPDWHCILEKGHKLPHVPGVIRAAKGPVLTMEEYEQLYDTWDAGGEGGEE